MAGRLKELSPFTQPYSGAPLSTEQHMVIAPNSKDLYSFFLNSEESNSCSLRHFTIGADGQLTHIGNVELEGDQPEGLAISHDGATVYAAVYDHTTEEGFLYALSVGGGGGLTQIQQYVHPENTSCPVHLTLSYEGSKLYYTNAVNTVYAMTRSEGKVTPVGECTIDISEYGTGATSLAITQDDQKLFLAMKEPNPGDNKGRGIVCLNAGSTPTFQSYRFTNSELLYIRLSPDEQHIYAFPDFALEQPQGVKIFQRHGFLGTEVTEIGETEGLPATREGESCLSPMLSPSGSWLYVPIGKSIRQYERDPATGLLTLYGDIAVGASGEVEVDPLNWAEVTPDGKFMYMMEGEGEGGIGIRQWEFAKNKQKMMM